MKHSFVNNIPQDDDDGKSDTTTLQHFAKKTKRTLEEIIIIALLVWRKIELLCPLSLLDFLKEELVPPLHSEACNFLTQCVISYLYVQNKITMYLLANVSILNYLQPNLRKIQRFLRGKFSAK